MSIAVMTKNTARTLVWASAASLALASASHAADTPRPPSLVIAALADRIYVVAETTGSVEDMIKAEVVAADEIRRYVASGSTDGLLGEGGKPSPLAQAAYFGYPNIATELLKSESVRSHINDTDLSGMTPWIASVFSMRQSAWVCNPALFDNFLAVIPMLVTQGYYVSNPNPPYRAIRKALEQAGATASMSKAADAWSATCKNQSAEGKAAVQRSTDVQSTVQQMGLTTLTTFLQTLQSKKRGSERN